MTPPFGSLPAMDLSSPVVFQGPPIFLLSLFINSLSVSAPLQKQIYQSDLLNLVAFNFIPNFLVKTMQSAKGNIAQARVIQMTRCNSCVWRIERYHYKLLGCLLWGLTLIRWL